MNKVPITDRINLTGKIIIHVVAWATFFILPVFLLDSFDRIYHYAPLFYVSSCLLLIPFYYLNYFKFIPDYFLQKKVIYYSGILLLSILIYMYLPVWITSVFPEGEWNHPMSGIRPAHQVKLRMGTMILFFVILLFSIIFHLFELQRLKKDLESEKTKAELSLLKSQINPHFLFNTLNSIYFMALKKMDEAPKAIITLSDMMRYILTEANADFIDLEQEINYIEKYIGFQELRIPKQTTLHYHKEINAENVVIAPLILIPFIENAFKFGVSANTKSSIEIFIKVNKQILTLAVENRIIAKKEETNGTSFGMKNIMKRLNLIYPDRHELIIQDNGEIYRVDLRLNL
ncbi:MAG: sensor histidine kinase [Saprospiraceae bacterium]|nr:sensor histidine kinase [Saprospiraceae bacterium]MCB9322509.1 sensor histidine kinase [Lewinellaceae bacterium]